MRYKVYKQTKDYDLEPGQHITIYRNSSVYKKMLALSKDKMYNEMEQDVIEEECDDEDSDFDSRFTESRDTY